MRSVIGSPWSLLQSRKDCVLRRLQLRLILDVRGVMVTKFGTMNHCSCIRNSDYSLHAYILYVQGANHALDGWYHSNDKERRKR